MIKLNGYDIMRDGVKIGWVNGIHLFNHTGQKVGYADADKIYDESGKKLAYVEGEYVFYVGENRKARIEDEVLGIDSALLSNTMRIAIKLFFGN